MPVDYKGKRSFFNPISPDANGDETVKLIVKTINTYSQSPFVKKTVEILKAKSPDRITFLKNLFGVACKNVEYLMDEPGHEVVYTPQLLMKMGKGDCKKFTTFIGAVLKAAGFDGVPKVVDYRPGKDWEHIYIISRDPDHPKGYYTLDPVNHCKWDSEVKYRRARLNFLDGTNSKIIMGNKLSLMGNLPTDNDAQSFMQGVNESANSLLEDLQAVSGVGCPRSYHTTAGLGALEESYLNGINDENMIHGDEEGINGTSEIGRKKSAASGSRKAQKTKKSKAEKKEKRKKLFHKMKKFAPAMVATRAAFLSLVKLGGALQKMKGLHINLAAHLAKAMSDPVKAKPVLDIWYKFGGEKEALMKAIVQAGKSKMHGIGDAEMMLAEGTSGIGVAPAVAAAAVITAATPILVPIIKMLKKDKQIPAETADRIQEGVETAEEVALTTQREGGLTPQAAASLVKSKLVRESMQDDSGGNAATVRDIQTEAETGQNFPRVKSPGGNDLTDTQDRTAENANLPVKQNETPQAVGAKSMFNSIYNPTSWIQITLAIVATGEILNAPGWLVNACTSVSITCTIITTINLFINNKKRSKWQKVN